tara:strand:+ start:321 stop:509 length:189 start_codon:yes stop_codon:yes gene_type:complete
MKIKDIKRKHDKDFKAVYECETCGATEVGYGYDEAAYYTDILPNLECLSCGEVAPTYKEEAE